MPFPTDISRRTMATRYFLLQWRAEDVARELRLSCATAFRIQRNLHLYGSSLKPRHRTMGRPRSLTPGDEELLLAFLVSHPIADQQEMLWFLWEERGIRIHRTILGLWLKKVWWSQKKARRSAKELSLDIRRGFLSEMVGIMAEQMVFLDESLFNETMGWRLTA